MKSIAVVFGTRPEVIKLAELIKILKKTKGVETTLVYTGQHYDYNLFKIFAEELELPKIDINLEIRGGSNAEQVCRMLKKLYTLFAREKFDVVVAEGDTNSVVAAALAAFYAKTRFAHIEAGLRSFDSRMPEEANRIVADNLSYYAFAPTEIALKNLEKSSARKGGIAVTGNTIVEAVEASLGRAGKSKILEKLGLEGGGYALLTAHRQEYVDRKENLEALLKAVEEIEVGVVFPVHPRTKKNLHGFGLWEKAKCIGNLRLIEPVGYFDFLQLASNSMFLMSDSGGIQEEASVYKKFVIVLRDNTERPEILGKFGELTGYNAGKIVRIAKNIIANPGEMDKKLQGLPCPFGDGKASEKMAKILVEEE